MAHIFWFSENMEEKQLNFIQRLELSKNMQFGADADIYLTKKWWISDTCNANQLDIYSRYSHKII